MITLYAYDTPNGRKIPLALEEMGLPYRIQIVDITRGEQLRPDFLAISPNNRIPAIIDPDGPGGTTLSVFESAAILLYLGERSGQFLPTDLRARVPVLEWLAWQIGGFGPMLGQVHHFLGVADPAARDYGVTRYKNEARRLFGVLDRRLATDVEFLAGPLSVADFACLPWSRDHDNLGIDLAEFPHVRRWHDTLMARPGVQRGFAAVLS